MQLRTPTFGALVGFGLQICAGAAAVIWPSHLWVAYGFFALGALTIVVSTIWWVASNRAAARKPFDKLRDGWRFVRRLGSPAQSLPLSVTLSSFVFSNYAGLFRDGMRTVAVPLSSGEAKVTTDKSNDEQVFLVNAGIINLSEERVILTMRLILERKDGRKFAISAGRQSRWGLLMGEHDEATVMLRKKGMPVPSYLDFPLTIEPRSPVDGRIAFICPLPRDMFHKDWFFAATRTIEITDALSGKSIQMPPNGTYRGL